MHVCVIKKKCLWFIFNVFLCPRPCFAPSVPTLILPHNIITLSPHLPCFLICLSHIQMLYSVKFWCLVPPWQPGVYLWTVPMTGTTGGGAVTHEVGKDYKAE